MTRPHPFYNQTGIIWSTMTDKKEVKPKQTGMALEMDVIKKITHQLERLPRGEGAEARIMSFVTNWAARPQILGLPPPQANGQLPLAPPNGKQSDLFE